MSPLRLEPSPTARVFARVNLDAYRYNCRKVIGRMKHGAALCAVVKANAYGHGAVPVARECLAAGAQRLAVVTIPEAVALREAGIDAPIQLLGPCLPEELAPGVRADLIFSVSSEDEIEALADRTRALHQGRRRGRKTRVHLLVDTGMGRSGFAPDELWPAVSRVLAEKTLELEGAFTHFSSAEEIDPTFTREQIALFRNTMRDLEERGVRIKVRHIANSAASLFYPESQLDMVRIGALLHGCRAWNAKRDGLELMPTLSLHTRVVHLGKRPAGWTVGYNRRHRCHRESILATLPVGYRDGYRRALSGRSEVLVRGYRVPVIGTISMDYIVVDVTALQNTPQGLPAIGDEVTLIGSSAETGERITLEELALASGTIPYVITTQIAANVERCYTGTVSAPAEQGHLEDLTAEKRSNTIDFATEKRAAKEARTKRRIAAGA